MALPRRHGPVLLLGATGLPAADLSASTAPVGTGGSMTPLVGRLHCTSGALAGCHVSGQKGTSGRLVRVAQVRSRCRCCGRSSLQPAAHHCPGLQSFLGISPEAACLSGVRSQVQSVSFQHHSPCQQGSRPDRQQQAMHTIHGWPLQCAGRKAGRAGAAEGGAPNLPALQRGL